MHNVFKNKVTVFTDFLKKHILFFLCLFLFAGAFRYYFVESSIIQHQAVFSFHKIMPWRFMAIFIINSVLFVTLFRLRHSIFSIIFYILQSLYLFIHYAYYAYFKTVFHADQFVSQFSEGIALLKHNAVPFGPKHLLIFVDAPFLILLIIMYSTLNRRLNSYPKIANYLKNAVIITLSCIILSSLGLGQGNLIHGLLTNDVARLLRIKITDAPYGGLNYADDIIDNKKVNYPLQNIICIQVESLDADVVNYKYKGKYITPFLHQLTTQSIYYPYMISYTEKGHTSDTEFVVLNSVWSPNGFPLYKFPLESYPNSLLCQLAKFNYQPIAFHNNGGSFFNRNVTFSKMGFMQFYDLHKMHLKEQGWGAADADVFRFVKGQLKTQVPPFLYYIITMSSHEPYNYVRQYFHNESYDDIDKRIVSDYFNSFSYVDACLQDFVNYVKTNFINTYIFIFGDHPSDLGVEFLFKNWYVSLFIITPDDKSYVETKQIVTTLDLAPTILFASRIKFEIHSQGTNLLDCPLKKHMPIFTDASLFNKFRTLKKDDYAFQEMKNIPPRYVAHAGGGLYGRTATNSLEALNNSLRNGLYLIELDFNWTNDNQIVLIHDWDTTVKELFWKEPRIYSLEEFKSFKAVYNLTQLSLDDLANWLLKRPYVRIVTDAKRNNVEMLRYISQKYKDVRDQFIPQIYEFNEYAEVRQLGYKDIIFTLYKSNYPDEGILEFVRNHHLFAVAMPIERARSSLPEKLNRMGIFVYAHTVNNLELEEHLSAHGVHGFYTDLLTP